MPQWLQPCEDAKSLCPSCALFGSAPSKQSQRHDGVAAAAYRGHVRFFDFVATASRVLKQVQLAPMLGPKPSAGNFYLDNSGADDRTRAAEEQPPLREWGSQLDSSRPRPIAGRKHYWHTTPRKVGPRYKLGNHLGKANQGKTLTIADLVDRGAIFEGRFVFESLSRAQLGAILAVLNPTLLATPEFAPDDGRVFCWHVGGGRPLGLGSVTLDDETPDREAIRLTLDAPAGGRYTGETATTIDGEFLKRLVMDFVATVPQGVRDTWPDLAAMLTHDYVNPDIVRYPSVAKWPSTSDVTPDYSGDHSLDWWKPAGGPAIGAFPFKKDGDATFVTLPRPSSPDPSLPIDPLAGAS